MTNPLIFLGKSVPMAYSNSETLEALLNKYAVSFNHKMGVPKES